MTARRINFVYKFDNQFWRLYSNCIMKGRQFGRDAVFNTCIGLNDFHELYDQLVMRTLLDCPKILWPYFHGWHNYLKEKGYFEDE